MVRVVLWGSLKSAAGGRSEIEVAASNVRELLSRLGEMHPELEPVLEQGVSVSIDGQIYRDALFQRVTDESEVYLLPRMAGG
jgi:molybdopterin converting factor small subunit